MGLEEELDTSIDESVFASVSKVKDLAKPMIAADQTPFPKYNRGLLARAIRRFMLVTTLLPITRWFTRAKVTGLENLNNTRGPVIFAANHESYMDTSAILARLPGNWRYRIAPAMWKEYFEPHFHPEKHPRRERWINSLIYFLVTLLYNAFPIPQSETVTRESIRYAGELVEEGWSILIFPEGERNQTGQVGRFLPGVGLMASRLHLPVVPIRLRGLDRVWPRASTFPHRGRIELSIGAPLMSERESFPELARKLESVIRCL